MSTKDKSKITKKTEISWDTFHRESKKLVRMLPKEKYWAILIITRGGLVAGAVVARELGIKFVDVVCMESYTDDHQQQGIKMIKMPCGEIMKSKGAGVLIVDELTDTGGTTKKVKKMLPEADIATVFAKPKGEPTVDYFVRQIPQDTWIYFPWDLDLAYVEPINDKNGK